MKPTGCLRFVIEEAQSRTASWKTCLYPWVIRMEQVYSKGRTVPKPLLFVLKKEWPLFRSQLFRSAACALVSSILELGSSDRNGQS